MGSRSGPPDGWDELPDCATDCFYDGLEGTDCAEDDMECWCEEGNWEIIGKSLDECKDCSGRDLWQLGASYQVMCDTAEKDSKSKTTEPTPSITQFLANDQPTSSPTADAESTSLTFVPIASHTPDPNDLNSSSLNSRNTIPTPTIIGMAVGFAVAGLLVVGLILLWLRERKKRKSLEWSTEPKRESKLSVGSKRASKRSTKGHGSMQVMETTIWRPSGIAGSPPP